MASMMRGIFGSSKTSNNNKSKARKQQQQQQQHQHDHDKHQRNGSSINNSATTISTKTRRDIKDYDIIGIDIPAALSTCSSFTNGDNSLGVADVDDSNSIIGISSNSIVGSVVESIKNSDDKENKINIDGSVSKSISNSSSSSGSASVAMNNKKTPLVSNRTREIFRPKVSSPSMPKPERNASIKVDENENDRMNTNGNNIVMEREAAASISPSSTLTESPRLRTQQQQQFKVTRSSFTVQTHHRYGNFKQNNKAQNNKTTKDDHKIPTKTLRKTMAPKFSSPRAAKRIGGAGGHDVTLNHQYYHRNFNMMKNRSGNPSNVTHHVPPTTFIPQQLPFINSTSYQNNNIKPQLLTTTRTLVESRGKEVEVLSSPSNTNNSTDKPSSSPPSTPSSIVKQTTPNHENNENTAVTLETLSLNEDNQSNNSNNIIETLSLNQNKEEQDIDEERYNNNNNSSISDHTTILEKDSFPNNKESEMKNESMNEHKDSNNNTKIQDGDSNHSTPTHQISIDDMMDKTDKAAVDNNTSSSPSVPSTSPSSSTTSSNDSLSHTSSKGSTSTSYTVQTQLQKLFEPTETKEAVHERNNHVNNTADSLTGVTNNNKEDDCCLRSTIKTNHITTSNPSPNNNGMQTNNTLKKVKKVNFATPIPVTEPPNNDNLLTSPTILSTAIENASFLFSPNYIGRRNKLHRIQKNNHKKKLQLQHTHGNMNHYNPNPNSGVVCTDCLSTILSSAETTVTTDTDGNTTNNDLLSLVSYSQFTLPSKHKQKPNDDNNDSNDGTELMIGNTRVKKTNTLPQTNKNNRRKSYSSFSCSSYNKNSNNKATISTPSATNKNNKPTQHMQQQQLQNNDDLISVLTEPSYAMGIQTKKNTNRNSMSSNCNTIPTIPEQQTASTQKPDGILKNTRSNKSITLKENLHPQKQVTIVTTNTIMDCLKEDEEENCDDTHTHSVEDAPTLTTLNKKDDDPKTSESLNERHQSCNDPNKNIQGKTQLDAASLTEVNLALVSSVENTVVNKEKEKEKDDSSSVSYSSKTSFKSKSKSKSTSSSSNTSAARRFFISTSSSSSSSSTDASKQDHDHNSKKGALPSTSTYTSAFLPFRTAATSSTDNSNNKIKANLPKTKPNRLTTKPLLTKISPTLSSPSSSSSFHIQKPSVQSPCNSIVVLRSPQQHSYLCTISPRANSVTTTFTSNNKNQLLQFNSRRLSPCKTKISSPMRKHTLSYKKDDIKEEKINSKRCNGYVLSRIQNINNHANDNISLLDNDDKNNNNEVVYDTTIEHKENELNLQQEQEKQVKTNNIEVADSNNNINIGEEAAYCRVGSITDINGRLKRTRDIQRKNPRRETGGSNVLAPRHAVLVHPMFRRKHNNNYDDYEQQQQQQQQEEEEEEERFSNNEEQQYELQNELSYPDDEDDNNDDDDSYDYIHEVDDITQVSITTSTNEEIEFANNELVDSTTNTDTVTAITTNEILSDNDDTDTSLVDDDESDYKLSTINGNPRSSKHKQSSSSNAFKQVSFHVNHDPTMSNYNDCLHNDNENDYSSPPSTPDTFDLLLASTHVVDTPMLLQKQNKNILYDDKENVSIQYSTTTPTPKNKKHTTKKQLNNTTIERSKLCLSPVQRTPQQARKWRTLKAAVEEKDSNIRNNTTSTATTSGKKSKKNKKKILKDRRSGISIGNKFL